MRLIVPMFVGALVFSLAPDARAIEVMCSDGPAACTISNDPFQWIDCTCNGRPGFGGTGGSENPWEGMSEDELLVECEALLPEACYPDETSGSGTSGGSGGATETNSGGVSDSGVSSTSAGTASGTDSGTDSGVATDGDGSNDDTTKKSCRVDPHGDPGPAGLLLVALLARRRRAKARADER